MFESFYQQLAGTTDWKPLDGLQILDLGCGTGYLAGLLKTLGAQYHGIDKQPEFIDFAQKTGKVAMKPLFTVMDLDGPSLIKRDYKFTRPDFALSVMLLEHLHEPQALLTRLRESTSPGQVPPILLLVTENPSYYGHALPDDAQKNGYLRPITKVPIVCLGGAEVNVTPREHYDVAVMLRDAGYTVLEEGFHRLPGKWDHFARREYKCQGRKDVNWGLHPFRSLITQPLPIAHKTGSVEFTALVEHSVLHELRHSDQATYLKKIEETGRFIRLAPDHLLLTRHDLGGVLYIVTNGSLTSKDQPEMGFNQFDLLGELEANHGTTGEPVFSYFIQDIRAGSSGAEVFVIPECVATPLLARGGSLVNALFSGLRRKLVLRNHRLSLRAFSDKSFTKKKLEYYSNDWTRVTSPDLNTTESIKGMPPDLAKGLLLQTTKIPFGDIQKYELGRFAGVLIDLCHREAEMKRISKKVVFCDIGILQRRAEIRDGSEGATGGKYARLLMSLGVLDAIPPQFLSKFKDPNNTPLDQRIFFDLSSHLFSKIKTAFGARPENDCGICLSELNAVAQTAFERELFRKNAAKMAPTTAFFSDMQSRLAALTKKLKITNNPDKESILTAVRRAATGLCELNLLFKDGKPRFFLIHDMPFLRTLTYASDAEVDRALVVKALAQRKNEDLDFSSFEAMSKQLADADDSNGRIYYYAGALAQFLRNSWDKNERLSYSLSGDMNLELPANFEF
jgi:SAM-dependent methyltransferase